jgi:hypothetical protein
MENIVLTLLTILCTTTAAFLLGFILGRRKSKIYENSGEAIVRKKITVTFKGMNYHLLNNITIPYEDGTTQVDHILVSTKGIFVIETKHYTGWILANEKSPVWTQVKFRVKSRFSSPTRQNYRHMKAIQGILDFIPRELFHSLVVFTGDAVFKTDIPAGVFTPSQMIAEIRGFEKDALSLEKMQLSVGRLECVRYSISKKTDLEHQNYLNQKFGEA